MDIYRVQRIPVLPADEVLAEYAYIPHLKSIVTSLARRYQDHSGEAAWDPARLNIHVAHNFIVKMLADSYVAVIDCENCRLEKSEFDRMNEERAKFSLCAMVSQPDLIVQAFVTKDGRSAVCPIAIEVKTSAISAQAALDAANDILKQWCDIAGMSTESQGFIPFGVHLREDGYTLHDEEGLLNIWSTGVIPESIFKPPVGQTASFKFYANKRLTSFAFLETAAEIRTAPSFVRLLDADMQDIAECDEVTLSTNRVLAQLHSQGEYEGVEPAGDANTAGYSQYVAALPLLNGVWNWYARGGVKVVDSHKRVPQTNWFHALPGSVRVPWGPCFMPQVMDAQAEDITGVQRYIQEYTTLDELQESLCYDNNPQRPVIEALIGTSGLTPDTYNLLTFAKLGDHINGRGDKKKHNLPAFSLYDISKTAEPAKFTKMVLTNRTMAYAELSTRQLIPSKRKESVVFNNADKAAEAVGGALYDYVTSFYAIKIILAYQAALMIVKEKSKINAVAKDKRGLGSVTPTAMKLIMTDSADGKGYCWGIIITVRDHSTLETHRVNFTLVFFSDLKDGQYCYRLKSGKFLCITQLSVQNDVLSAQLKPSVICEAMQWAQTFSTCTSGEAYCLSEIVSMAMSPTYAATTTPYTKDGLLGDQFIVLLGDYFEASSAKEAVDVILRMGSIIVDNTLFSTRVEMPSYVRTSKAFNDFKWYNGSQLPALKILRLLFDTKYLIETGPRLHLAPAAFCNSGDGTLLEIDVEDTPEERDKMIIRTREPAKGVKRPVLISGLLTELMEVD